MIKKISSKHQLTFSEAYGLSILASECCTREDEREILNSLTGYARKCGEKIQKSKRSRVKK